VEAPASKAGHSAQVPGPALVAVSRAACGSPHYAGCYHVGAGRKIHRPSAGRDVARTPAARRKTTMSEEPAEGDIESCREPV
jgi:hypothetical protein